MSHSNPFSFRAIFASRLDSKRWMLQKSKNTEEQRKWDILHKEDKVYGCNDTRYLVAKCN